MTKQPKRYLITSALPYANGALHLGHLAGAYLPADVYVRYLRILGKDVVWVCGSDEHGAAITIRAKKEGTSPKTIIDKYHTLNKSTFEKLGISFDYYHRTSEQLHHETAQEFFKKLYEKGGEFEEHTSEQYYDEEFDQFLADRYIVGTCPKCSHPEAYGDQCENCGSALSPTELIDPRSTLSNKAPILKTTTHWYFKLDKHNDWLKDWIETGMLDGEQHHDPKVWKKHVLGQCLSWLDVDGGLKPRAITRDLDWGIPVPLADDKAKGKVLYVWFDAPIGYISATRQWALENGKDWEVYWKDDESELIHFIGKDNIVFHCIVFPAMLKAYGDYNLPVNVPANQFLNFEGRKFSKSKGWGIEQHDYLEEFKDFQNKEDALRYALIRNMPENKDSDFKWDDFIDFHDNELVATIGNSVNRVLSLSYKYYGGKVPTYDATAEFGYELEGEVAATYESFLQQLARRLDELEEDVLAFNFRPAAAKMMNVAREIDLLLASTEPWKLQKNNPELVQSIMHAGLQGVVALSVAIYPFLPFTSNKLRSLLNLSTLDEAIAIGNNMVEDLKNSFKNGEPIVVAGREIEKPQLLFAKINDRKDKSRLATIERQKEKLAAVLAAEKATNYPEVKPIATFDDFQKIDLRTGTIVAAEKMKKAKKLLKLTVDVGFEQRTVVSGIAEYYQPDAIIGQQVVMVANLAPRKLRGVESQGMILMAEDADGKLVFVSPANGFPNGWVVK